MFVSSKWFEGASLRMLIMCAATSPRGSSLGHSGTMLPQVSSGDVEGAGRRSSYRRDRRGPTRPGRRTIVVVVVLVVTGGRDDPGRVSC